MSLNASLESSATIRRLVPEDAIQLFDLIDSNRPELAKFWWEQKTQSVADSLNFITSVNELEATNGAPTRGICVEEGLIGVTSLHTIDWEKRRALVGCWIDKNQAGKGYTSGAMRLLIEDAFGRLGLHEVRLATRETNKASRALAQKLGFTLLKIDQQPMWQDEANPRISTAIYALRASNTS